MDQDQERDFEEERYNANLLNEEREVSDWGPEWEGHEPEPAGYRSLGERQHDSTYCDRDGNPHLGPCIEPGTEAEADSEAWGGRGP